MIDSAAFFDQTFSRNHPPMKTIFDKELFRDRASHQSVSRRPSFRTFKLATVAIGIALGLSIRPAQAAPYVVTLQQVGSDVVATGSGAIDLTGLMGPNTTFGGETIAPNEAFIVTGATGFFDIFTGFSTIIGPTSFGPGAGTPAFSGTGDHVGINGLEQLLFVPQNYVSGTPLSSGSTWPFQTFASLGVTPGTYVWTWGAGPNQKFTLDALAPAVPDAGSTFGLFSLALITLFGAARFRSQQLA
jgi:hypothetical protein